MIQAQALSSKSVYLKVVRKVSHFCAIPVMRFRYFFLAYILPQNNALLFIVSLLMHYRQNTFLNDDEIYHKHILSLFIFYLK